MRGFVFWSCPLGLLLCAALASCRTVQSVTPATLPASCTTALVPHPGDEKLDREIARLQQEVRAAERSRELFVPKLEQLGWKFVEKARLTYDAGYYKLAEACAQCIEARAASAQPSPQSAATSSSASSVAVASVPASPTPSSPAISAEALLLRGHVLHNLHRFKEAEVVARQLVAQRGLAFDYGLLGDVLLEQGKLAEAIAAYQQMMNLKPGLQAYTRAAYVRWLQGDLPGALALMQLAVRAGSPQQGEATAWAWTRLALYELQAGNRIGARRAIEAALNYQADYAPALLARGRLLLAEENLPAALDSLRL